MAKKQIPLWKERWKLIYGKEDGRGEMSRIVKQGDEDFIVAYCIREHINKLAQAEDDKRARLISAAPNLLSACKSMLEFAESVDASGYDGGCGDIVSLLKAVIEAAE